MAPSNTNPMTAKPKERPFSSPSEIVTFITGKDDEERIFIVHKEFACKHSSVWKAAFNGSFIEGKTQTYRLEDTTGDAFRLLVQWLYQEKLDLLIHDGDGRGPTDGHRAMCSNQDLILTELWTLGERFLIRPLQNYVMAEMYSVQASCGKMSSQTGKHIYENTPDGSPLRRFAVDQICWLADPVEMAVLDAIPSQMVKDIALLLAKQVPAHVRHEKAVAMTASDYYVTEDES